MTASLHKLTAGSGYDYLTRQVAVQDSTEKGHASLASYYTEKGEVPGRWVGSGLAALEMPDGSSVSEEQMRALFGSGFHPNKDVRLAALPTGASREQIRDATRLGTPFKVVRGRVEVPAGRRGSLQPMGGPPSPGASRRHGVTSSPARRRVG